MSNTFNKEEIDLIKSIIENDNNVATQKRYAEVTKAEVEKYQANLDTKVKELNNYVRVVEEMELRLVSERERLKKLLLPVAIENQKTIAEETLAFRQE